MLLKEVDALLDGVGNRTRFRAGIKVGAGDFDRLDVQFLLLGFLGKLLAASLEIGFLTTEIDADRAFETLGKR